MNKRISFFIAGLLLAISTQALAYVTISDGTGMTCMTSIYAVPRDPLSLVAHVVSEKVYPHSEGVDLYDGTPDLRVHQIIDNRDCFAIGIDGNHVLLRGDLSQGLSGRLNHPEGIPVVEMGVGCTHQAEGDDYEYRHGVKVYLEKDPEKTAALKDQQFLGRLIQKTFDVTTVTYDDQRKTLSVAIDGASRVQTVTQPADFAKDLQARLISFAIPLKVPGFSEKRDFTAYIDCSPVGFTRP